MKQIFYQTELLKNNIKLDQAQEKILNFFNIDNYSGIYLYGDVGTGKTMLLDLFFNHLTNKRKCKIHFHAFMLEIHAYLHKLENSNKKNIDFIKYAAKYIAEQYQILYIDELYIDDIADAMIVGRLFRELFTQKVIVLITSNFAPENLYKNGLQRDSFIPFIELMQAKMQILRIESNHDYRKNKIKSIETTYYIYNNDIDSQKFVFDSFLKMTNNSEPTNRLLHINARELICPITAQDCAVFSFDQLCRAPMSSSDYITICKEFNIIILSEIPKLSYEEHNEVKRFIDLIDIIYDFKRILLCSAKSEIESIYKAGKWHFEFLRTISRIHEMQSQEYLEKLTSR